MNKKKIIYALLALFTISSAQTVEASQEEQYISVKDQNIRAMNVDYARPIQFVTEGGELTYKGETTTNGYFRVEHDGKIGYIHRGDVTSVSNYNSDNKEIKDLKLTKHSGIYVAVKEEILRSGNSEHYSSVGLIPASTELEASGITDNGYFKVSHEGQEGYIHRTDLTSLENYHSDQTDLHPANIINDNKRELYAIIDQNIRTGDSKRYRPLKLVERGEALEVLGQTDSGWFKVKYKDTVGYLYRGDLTSKESYDHLINGTAQNALPVNRIRTEKALGDAIEKAVMESKSDDEEIVIDYYGDDYDRKTTLTNVIRLQRRSSNYKMGNIRNWRYYSIDKGDHYTIGVKMLYRTSPEENQFIDKEVKRISNQIIKNNHTEYEKVKTLFDYVVNNYSYNKNTKGSESSPYTFFNEKQGTCNAYSLAMSKLLDHNGIDNYFVIGDVESGLHAWNMVKINNKWYNLDVTWSFPKSEYGLHNKYKNFLVSDKRFNKTHKPHDPASLPKASDTQYDGIYDGNFSKK